MFRSRFLFAAGLLCGAMTVGCNDSPTGGGLRFPTPTPTPTPACSLALTCDAIAGFPGIYKCSVQPAGPVTYIVGAVSVGAADGILFAVSGDVVSACRSGCNCSLPILLR